MYQHCGRVYIHTHIHTYIHTYIPAATTGSLMDSQVIGHLYSSATIKILLYIIRESYMVTIIVIRVFPITKHQNKRLWNEGREVRHLEEVDD